MAILVRILLVVAFFIVSSWSVASLLVFKNKPNPKAPAQQIDRQWKQLRIALQLNPNNAAYWMKQAAFALNDASGGISKQDRELAQKSLRQASLLAPSWEMPILRLANLIAFHPDAASDGSLLQCRTLYEQVLERSPSYGYAHYCYGDYLFVTSLLRHDTPETVRADMCRQYGKALTLMRPTQWNLHWYKRAEERAYDKCVSSAPNYALAMLIEPSTPRQWYLMGLHLGRKGPVFWRSEHWHIYFDIAASHNHSQTIASLADGIDRGGLPRAAIDFLNHFLTENSAQADIWFALVNIMARHRDLFTNHDIVEKIKTAYDKASFTSDNLLALGRLACQRKDPVLAEALFKQAATQTPREATYYDAWGKCDLESGRPAQAIIAYRKALDISPNSVKYRIGLGKALAQSDQFPSAIEEFNKVLAVDPKNQEAIKYLRSKGIY